MAAITATPQVEADKRLVQFRTYEDYLTSLVIVSDHCYLQSTSLGRTIAELGYRYRILIILAEILKNVLICRSSGETLTREQFEKRLAAVIEYLYPTFKPYVLASENLVIQDPFLKEMALRECSNRMGILAVSLHNKLIGSRFPKDEPLISNFVINPITPTSAQ